MTAPGIPNQFALSTSCFGTRLPSIEDQIFAAVAMGFRRIELGLSEAPPSMEGLEDSKRETLVAIASLVAGCRDSRTGRLTAQNLASLDGEERERALNSVRRHVRLAIAWGCPTVVVRGSKVENPKLRDEGRLLEARACDEAADESFQAEVAEYVKRVQAAGHSQIQHLCRSLHTLMKEAPDIRFAIEPGRDIDDLMGFEAMGWVIDDLNGKGLGYWHDVGHVHLRSCQGLPEHGQWLEAYGARMVGVHLQDAAAHEGQMPLGLGEVDFKLLASYVPGDALRVIELDPRHGRAEILASIQFLVDAGF